jgi:hypothetical protein
MANEKFEQIDRTTGLNAPQQLEDPEQFISGICLVSASANLLIQVSMVVGETEGPR